MMLVIIVLGFVIAYLIVSLGMSILFAIELNDLPERKEG